MFDTNIFNRILDDKDETVRTRIIESKDVHEYFITHIQPDELTATHDEKRRKGLLEVFKDVNQLPIPTESGVWDISRWDYFKWGDENGLYDRILEQLEKEKPHHRGNKKDALIGETSIKNNITLVTDDRALRETVIKRGGVAICLSDFLKETG